MTLSALQSEHAPIPPPILLSQIVARVEQRFHLKQGALAQRSRRQAIALPRQVSFYLARKLTSLSFPNIADRFKMDYTTVMHGRARVEELIQHNAQLAADVAALEQILRERHG